MRSFAITISFIKHNSMIYLYVLYFLVFFSLYVLSWYNNYYYLHDNTVLLINVCLFRTEDGVFHTYSIFAHYLIAWRATLVESWLKIYDAFATLRTSSARTQLDFPCSILREWRTKIPISSDTITCKAYTRERIQMNRMCV